ncbi:WxL domain surface cell wall-binding [Oceanobacillus limi]|uniref:WxL domain surface cell wall-binding n=1 Tax=Oceanobacillus limi TaxID=930131 RepID=A0A1I0D6I6_9BACI|nr:WxL domain-containing protein [Oceanobacillus limi]SET27114.1 WxL domain surface cell wall-binding [Oceanobacillus limi]
MKKKSFCQKKHFIAIVIFMVLLIPTDKIFGNSTSTDTKAEILPGNLNITYKSVPIAMNYQKDLDLLTGSIGDIVVTDSSGSGKGWKINVEASSVKTILDEGKETVLQNESIRIHKQGAKIVGEENMLPRFVGGAYLILDSGEPNTLLVANKSKGMGQFHISFPHDSLQLAVPNYREEYKYETTLTFSIIHGP